MLKKNLFAKFSLAKHTLQLLKCEARSEIVDEHNNGKSKAFSVNVWAGCEKKLGIVAFKVRRLFTVLPSESVA